MNSPRPRKFTDLAQSARRHLPALILPVLVFVIASTAALRLMPGQFISSAIVLPEPAPVDSVQLHSQVRQQLTERARLQRLIETLDLNHNTVNTSTGMDSLGAEVRDRISVNVSSEPSDKNAITISYRASDAETARRVTARLAEELVAEGLASDQKRVAPHADDLRKRALELSSKLQELEGRIPYAPGDSQEAAAATPIRGSQLGGETWRTQMNVESLKDQQYKLGQQIADLNSRIAAQQLIVEELKKGSSLNNSPTYALLITKRAELQGQRDNLIHRQELTDKHPRVLAITDQIAAINNQVEELRKQQAGTLSQTPEARELLALEADRRRLQLELEVTGREVKRRTANAQTPLAGSPRTLKAAPTRNADPTRLSQEYQRLKQEYVEVSARLQNAENGTEPGASVKQFRLLQPATLPQDSGLPNSLLVGFTAAAAGWAVGACLASGLDRRRRKTIQDTGDVEYYTRLPLLAAIPRNVTEEERRHLKRRYRALLAAGIAVALAATFALTRLLIFTEVFAVMNSR
jgi:protein tyrosine kinase modulator